MKTKLMKQNLGLFAFLLSLNIFLFSCSDEDDQPSLSNNTEIVSFSFSDLNVNATISNGSITATLPLYTDLTDLAPTIVVAEGATITPASGIAQDFTEPVTYVVRAEDGTEFMFTATINALAVVVNPVWERNLNSGGLPSWFTANNDRDLSVFGEFLYIHNNNDRIRVVNSATGADINVGELGFLSATQNFGGGNLNLLTTATDNQGRILGGNLRVGSASGFPWNMYVWENNDAPQELLFSYPVPAGVQLADNISVIGDVRGTATLFAPASGFAAQSPFIYKFNIREGSLDGEPVVIELDRNLGNAPSVVPVSNNANANLIVVGTGISNVAEYDQSGNLVSKLPDSLKDIEEFASLFNFALDVGVFEIGDRKFIATTSTDFANTNAAAGNIFIIDYTDGLENVTPEKIQRIPLTPEDNIDNNFNGTGGIGVTVNGDSAIVYGMLTNFGFGAYRITIE